MKNEYRIILGVYGSIEAGKEASVEFFNKWAEEVKATVPKDRLLVFEAKEGWEPLCKFLNVPIPENPYPRVNDTASMLRMFRNGKLVSVFVIYGLPIIFALLVFFFMI